MASTIFSDQSSRLKTAVIVLIILGFSKTVLADFEFVTQFGSTGTGYGQFDAPRGVVVNHEGKIVITESGNNRVQLCSDAGQCTRFGSFGDLSGEFDRPRGVAVNSVDRIFIADRGNDRIQSCASTGSCTDFGGSGTAVGKFESPRGISIDENDQIYITDTDHNRIQICDDAGLCTAFGELGSALGQFNSPSGIAVDSQGRLVIADRGNDRIQICTATGVCSSFGTFGNAPGEFNLPAGVAVDSRDRIIIVDRFNDRIQVCSQQGDCTVFGSFGGAPGQFDQPWGVTVDEQDRIIVADLGNDRIQIFAESTPPPVQITSFGASPDLIEEGQSVTLIWAVDNATSCTALAGTSDWRALTPNKAGGSAVITVASAGNYTFTLQCTDGTNTVSINTAVIVTPIATLLEMNAGLNDAWYYQPTSGQGFYIIVFPDLGLVSLSWFTYDTVQPGADVPANLGDAGHRWLTATGVYSGNRSVMDISITSGGEFDTPTDVDVVADGTIILTFSDCNSGTIEYDIPSIDRQGVIPIKRVANDNVVLCETLAEQSESPQISVQQALIENSSMQSDDPEPATEALVLAEMNPGLNDAWYYQPTSGQGFYIIVFPDLGLVSLSWFTYDTVQPDEGVPANLGDAGHRWLTATGVYSGIRSVMDISITSGGEFDTPTDVDVVADGTIILTFSDCNTGTIEYDIPSIDRQGVIPIKRVANDNIVLCETLTE